MSKQGDKLRAWAEFYALNKEEIDRQQKAIDEEIRRKSKLNLAILHKFFEIAPPGEHCDCVICQGKISVGTKSFKLKTNGGRKD